MAILSGGDAVFHELEVALGKRRQGDLGPGRYVEPQRSSAPDPEPEPEPVQVSQLPVSDQAGWQTHAKAAHFSGLVRSKLQSLVAPPAAQLAYPHSRPQLPPPGSDFEAQPDESELEHLLLVRYSRLRPVPRCTAPVWSCPTANAVSHAMIACVTQYAARSAAVASVT